MPGKAGPETKPRKSRLKVFRTSIGFHDAYVAAQSRKAALQAWGTDKDLFARGVAEEVIDPELMAEPLSAPGTVFKQLRSAPADLIEAPNKARKPKKVAKRATPKAAMPPVPPPPPPKPSEQQIEEARRTLEAAQREHEVEERNLAARERALARERRSMESRQVKELRLLTDKLGSATRDYQERLAAWQDKINRIEKA